MESTLERMALAPDPGADNYDLYFDAHMAMTPRGLRRMWLNEAKRRGLKQ